MVAYVLDCKIGEVSLQRDQVVDEGKLDQVARFIDRRIKREPLQYIIGETEFMGLPFKVTGDASPFDTGSIGDITHRSSFIAVHHKKSCGFFQKTVFRVPRGFANFFVA